MGIEDNGAPVEGGDEELFFGVVGLNVDQNAPHRDSVTGEESPAILGIVGIGVCEEVIAEEQRILPQADQPANGQEHGTE